MSAAVRTRALHLPKLFTARDGKDFAIDAEGGFWRALGFIENTCTLATVGDAAQAEEVGFALGRFHALIHDLDPARLHETLPGFHNAPGYLARFTDAFARPRGGADAAELHQCAAFIEARRGGSHGGGLPSVRSTAIPSSTTFCSMPTAAGWWA